MRQLSLPLVIAAFASTSLSAQGAHAGITSAAMVQDAAYQQTGPSTVAPIFSPAGNHFFDAEIFTASPTDFDGGTFTLPDGTSFPMVRTSPPFAAILYGTATQSSADLAALFPNGTYTLTATNSVTSTSQSVQIQYVDDFVVNSIPALTPNSFLSLHKANAAPLTVNFEGFTPDPRSTSSVVLFSMVGFGVDKGVFSSKTFSPGPLPSSTTSVVLPAGFLTKGWSYSFSVFDIQTLSGLYNGISASVGGASIVQSNTFQVTAVPEPASWALLLLGFGSLGFALRQRRSRERSGRVAG
jgi:hypothetical protein